MKKFFTLALALLLVLCLCACNQTFGESAVTAYTFPEGTAILGVNLSGLNYESGWQALERAVRDYQLTITVDGVEAVVDGQQIDLSCSQERYDAIANALEAGAPVDFAGLISFNEGKLRALVNEHFNKPVTEAAIVFDEASGAYILTPDAIGQSCNPNAIVSALTEQIQQLQTSAALKEVSLLIEPTLRDEDTALVEALATVNKMASVELTYSFTVEEETSTFTIPAEDIRSFISLGVDNVTPGINRSILESYVAQLSETYSIGNTTGDFPTTGGGTVNLTVTFTGILLDQEAMTEDLITCITEGISGERTAPFLDNVAHDMPYGGTYIEVNLSDQRLWFYKNGECILTTKLVSGKVSAGWRTPNGVYSIYDKETNVYLEGDDYRTFVNYWMPFYGGYGLHDATWRWVFGGDIYLYDGSHGCVNLPYNNAATIYNNVTVGTKVILYGGRYEVPPQEQVLSGTTSYSVAEDAGTITLNIKPKYSGPKMTYASSNTRVATVSKDGVVTIKGVGNATITVSTPAEQGYTAATISVAINVHSACEEGRHKMGTPTVITPATCQPGKEQVSCTKCSHTVEQEIAAVQAHTYGNWTQTVPPTCGATGLEERVCSRCQIAKETRDVAATGQHTEGNSAVTVAPGCTAEGVKTVYCAVCNASIRTEAVPATGHSHSWQVTKSATCTEAGEEKLICACGDVVETKVIPATGHNFSDGTCTICGTLDPSYTPTTGTEE